MERPATLDAYLAGLDAGQREAVERLRKSARAHLKGFREGFEYGMPFYRRGSDEGLGFAARGKGFSIYAGEPVLRLLERQLAGIDCGKGCARFKRADQVDWALIDLIFATVNTAPG